MIMSKRNIDSSEVHPNEAVDQLTRHLMFAPRVRRAEAALYGGCKAPRGT
jgi:hypothetical protein